MQVTKKKLPKGQIELQIELASEEILSYFKKAVNKISQETRINGFRSGKIPEDVLRKKVGEEKIMAEAVEQAVQDSYPKALLQEKLVTVGGPKIEILKQAPNNPFIYKATVALLPEIKIGDYKKVKVKKKPVEVKEEEVTKALQNLQKMRRKEILVNREAKKGDKAEVDINVYLDKVPLEGGTAKNQPIFIGEGNFIPGFEDQLIGLKKDREKEFKLRFPKDYFQKNLANREAEFKIKVNSVFALELPPLEDEFAKALGDFKTITELKNQIKQNLEQEAKAKEKQRQELAILEEIAKKSEFEEFPDILMEAEIDKMIQELKYDFERQGLKFEDYLTTIKKSEEELRKIFVPRAKKRVETALLIRKIAELEKIQVLEKELEEELERSRKIHQENKEMLKQIDSPDYRSFLRNVLVNRRVLEILERMATEE